MSKLSTKEVISQLQYIAPSETAKKEATRLILLAESFLAGGTGESYIVEMNLNEFIAYQEIKEVINHIKNLKHAGK